MIFFLNNFFNHTVVIQSVSAIHQCHRMLRKASLQSGHVPRLQQVASVFATRSVFEQAFPVLSDIVAKVKNNNNLF